MWQIEINGRELELGEDFSIDIELRHPMIEPGVIHSTYSIPFTFPFSANNSRVLHHTSAIEIRNRETHFIATLKKGGNIRHKGTLILKEIEKAEFFGQYQAEFVENSFLVELADQSLKDIINLNDYVLADNSEDVPDAVLDISLRQWPEVNFNFPMCRVDGFYGEYNKTFSGFINLFDGQNNRYYGNGLRINRNSFAPMPYVFFVLQQIFSGYQIKGAVIKDGEAQKVLMYSNFAADYTSRKYYSNVWRETPQTLPNMPAMNYYVICDIVNVDEDSCYNTATGFYIVQTGGPHRVNGSLNIRVITPGSAVYRANIIIMGGVHVMHFRSFDINYNQWYEIDVFGFYDFDNREIGVGINFRVTFDRMDTGRWVDCEGEVTVNSCEFINIDAENWNQFDTVVRYRDILPDISVGDFLIEIKETLGVQFFWNPFAKEVYVEWAGKSLEPGRELDWTDKLRSGHIIYTDQDKGLTVKYDVPDDVKINDFDSIAAEIFDISYAADKFIDLPVRDVKMNTIAFVRNENAFYIFSQNEETRDVEWIYKSWNMWVSKYGKITPEAEELVLKFRPAFMSREEYGGLEYLVPKIEGQGTSKYFPVGINDTPLILMLYHGHQLDVTGTYGYPFASPYNYNAAGENLQSYSLLLDDLTEGFVAKGVHRLRDAVARGELVKMLFDLTEADLVNLDFTKRIRIRYALFFAKLISINRSNTIQNKPAEVELIKIE